MAFRIQKRAIKGGSLQIEEIIVSPIYTFKQWGVFVISLLFAICGIFVICLEENSEFWAYIGLLVFGGGACFMWFTTYRRLRFGRTILAERFGLASLEFDYSKIESISEYGLIFKAEQA